VDCVILGIYTITRHEVWRYRGLGRICFGGITSIIAIAVARKYVNFSLTDSMIKPLIGASVMGLILVIVRRFLPVNTTSMAVLALLGLIVYGASMLTMMGLTLLEDAKRSVRTLLSRGS